TKINENIRDIKREKTRDSNVLEYGKEVRKLESGLRTLILFTGDVVNMLRKNSTVINRVDDRIYYFDKRSAILEQEIYSLQQKMAIN
ncbi:MAG: chemotaxis protein, partial [Lysinibacillus sp.]